MDQRVANRAFDTNYETHRGLIYKLACRGWGRLQSANVFVEFDDVMQEMSLAYVRAAEKYDATRGITFTAYLGRTIWNEFNEYANKLIGEQVALNLQSVEALSDISETDGGTLYDILPSNEWTPEQLLEARSDMRKNMEHLGPTAKFIVGQLINPRPELTKAIKAMQEQAKFARDNGINEYARAPRDVTITAIARHFNLDSEDVRLARRNLSRVFGVDLKGGA